MARRRASTRRTNLRRSLLLLGVVLLCVATALAGVWMALTPAWLGAGFEARPDGAVVITRLTADGPLSRVGAKVGDRLAAAAR